MYANVISKLASPEKKIFTTLNLNFYGVHSWKYMYLHYYTHTYTHLHTHTHTHPHTHTYTHTNTHIHTHTYTHTHPYTRTHTHTYTHVHTRTINIVHSKLLYKNTIAQYLIQNNNTNSYNTNKTKHLRRQDSLSIQLQVGISSPKGNNKSLEETLAPRVCFKPLALLLANSTNCGYCIPGPTAIVSTAKEIKSILATLQNAQFLVNVRMVATSRAWSGVMEASWMVRACSGEITVTFRAAGLPLLQGGRKISARRDGVQLMKLWASFLGPSAADVASAKMTF